jgi:hypothetical protein
VSDQVSHPYNTTGTIIVQYFFINQILESYMEDKRFCTECKHTSPNFNLVVISSWIEFWFINTFSPASI